MMIVSALHLLGHEGHVGSLLLHKVILLLENFGEKKTSKSSEHEMLKMTVTRAKTYVILTSLNYVHF